MLRIVFVAVDRTHAERSVTRPSRPRADALARCERGPLPPHKPPPDISEIACSIKAISLSIVPHIPQNKSLKLSKKNYLNPLDLGNNRVPAIWESKQNF